MPLLMSARTMKLFNAKKRESPARLPPTPQQLFDEAAADKDYSRKACLRTYHSRTILVTGPNAGEERSHPPGSQDEGKEGEPGGKVQSKWGKPLRGLWSHNRKQMKDTPSSASIPASVPAYITGDITWVEPGVWNGKKAHFILLHFEHRREKATYLERVELDLRVWQAGDAVKSMANHSHKPLATVLPPLADDLADNAPPIVLYAPRAVVGRPAGSQQEYYWYGQFREGDSFRFAGDLHAPQELGIRGAKETDPHCLNHFVAYGDSRHRIPPPDFSVALVVLSDGKPFDLTAYNGTYHWGFDPLRYWLWSPYKPARFCQSRALRPKGQKRIRCDFASQEMKVKIQELVQWCQPFDTVSHCGLPVSVADTQIWFGNGKGCVDRIPGDTRGCSWQRCPNCQGRF